MNDIWHGDSRIIGKDLPDGIDCVIADPPYGVDFRSFKATTPAGKAYVRDVQGDVDLASAIVLFDEVMDVVLPKCAPVSELYVFTKWEILIPWTETIQRLERHNFKYNMLLIWDKGLPGLGDIDGNWGCGHEMIFYCKRGRRDIPMRRSAIVHVDKLGAKQHIHPTEKPAALIEKLLEMSTVSGDLVVDPFSGSGSTSVAAQRLGRDSIGIEADDFYIEPSRARLEQTTLVF